MKSNSKQLPRGLRNRNPLNIRKSDQLWKGQTGHDGKFCIFQSNAYGYRAAFRILKTYNTKYRIYSVREIIARWAPPNDGNNTRGYIRKVCDLSGLQETDIIVAEPSDGDPYNVVMLVWAMAIVENGDRFITITDLETVRKGYEMAFGKVTVEK